MKPVIALVGRPNVGKSTLFNRLTRSRDALVLDVPGVTRDRHYGEGRAGGRSFIAIDTSLTLILPDMNAIGAAILPVTMFMKLFDLDLSEAALCVVLTWGMALAYNCIWWWVGSWMARIFG